MAENRLWGGRFQAEEDPLFAQFNDSLCFDRELLEEDVEGSLAYCRALERAGIFTQAERKKVERALRRILEEHLRDPDLVRSSGAEDVHTYVEQKLSGNVGGLALKLHTGRSRNDQVATDLRLYLRRKASGVESELNRLMASLAGAADRHMGVVVPGYTHLQRAQPVLFSHHLLAYGEMLLRDRERLRQCAVRLNECPLGSGALSGTVYAVDRTALAHDLGFSNPTRNSMDAVADRDFVLDFLFFASVLHVHLSRLAEDLSLFSSAEFGFVVMHDSFASGSSLMPQKKNPDAVELIRGKTGRVFGHLLSMLTVLKRLPLTYNKDLQEDKEGLFDCVRTVEICLRVMSRVIGSMEVRPERMTEAALDGHLNATELADYLVARGMPFREAHHLAGKMVVRALELGVRLEQMPLTTYQTFSMLIGEDVYDWLLLDRAIARRTEQGGTSPRTVRRALAGFRKRIER
jgi:argininosuccinate lyase/amino-acid N-acetyltransferase